MGHFYVGFGRANNQALGWVKGRYVLLLNTDAFVLPDILEKTVAYLDANLDLGIILPTPELRHVR